MTSPLGKAPLARSASPLPDLRPLSTGELIDRGFGLYRRHFAGLLLLALLCQIAPLAASQVCTTAIKFVPAQGNIMAHPEMDPGRNLLLLAIWIVGQVITFAFEMVMTTYLAAAYLDRGPSIRAGFAALRERFGAAVATSLLNLAIVALSLLFPLLAGAAIYLFLFFHPPQQFSGLLLFLALSFGLIVLSIAPVLVVFMRLMLTVPAVALEKLSAMAAVRRSSQLVRYDPGLGFWYWGEMRLSILLLPLFVIEILAFCITSLPMLFHDINEALVHGSIGQISAPPEAAVICSQILVVLSSSLLLPLYLIATTLFYYDVRIRREGFDLELMAEQAQAQAV